MIRRFILFGLLALAGCAGPGATTAPKVAVSKPQMPVAPETETGCLAAGGNWGPVGLLGTEACTMTSPTGGKQCMDSSECAGECWSSEPPGSKAGGYCQPTNMPFGCHASVVGGVVQPALCAD